MTYIKSLLFFSVGIGSLSSISHYAVSQSDVNSSIYLPYSVNDVNSVDSSSVEVNQVGSSLPSLPSSNSGFVNRGFSGAISQYMTAPNFSQNQPIPYQNANNNLDRQSNNMVFPLDQSRSNRDINDQFNQNQSNSLPSLNSRSNVNQLPNVSNNDNPLPSPITSNNSRRPLSNAIAESPFRSNNNVDLPNFDTNQIELPIGNINSESQSYSSPISVYANAVPSPVASTTTTTTTSSTNANMNANAVSSTSIATDAKTLTAVNNLIAQSSKLTNEQLSTKGSAICNNNRSCLPSAAETAMMNKTCNKSDQTCQFTQLCYSCNANRKQKMCLLCLKLKLTPTNDSKTRVKTACDVCKNVTNKPNVCLKLSC